MLNISAKTSPNITDTLSKTEDNKSVSRFYFFTFLHFFILNSYISSLYMTILMQFLTAWIKHS